MTNGGEKKTPWSNIFSFCSLIISLGAISFTALNYFNNIDSYGYDGLVGLDSSLTITQVSGANDVKIQNVRLIPTIEVENSPDTLEGNAVIVRLVQKEKRRVFSAENVLEKVCETQTKGSCSPQQIVGLDAEIDAGGTIVPIEVRGLPGRLTNDS
jgi:hypothetical protein